MKYAALVPGIAFILLTACTGAGGKKKSDHEQTLQFTICQERNVYERSDYGEPPQFAIWLENKETGDIRTVFVTYRTATGDFKGKAECPVSLPVWIGAFRKETGRNDFPVPRKAAPDAVTGATPKTKEFKVSVQIPKESGWYYYVEMNVSSDYTAKFPAVQDDGTIDSQGNGQPSLLYRGEISGISGEHSTPVLTGRSEQMYFSSEINPDLTGIGNAKDVFSVIKVVCL
jgi:hypothetical protein